MSYFDLDSRRLVDGLVYNSTLSIPHKFVRFCTWYNIYFFLDVYILFVKQTIVHRGTGAKT